MVPLFDSSVLACLTVGILAIERIEKQINQNIEDASKRKPIGARKRKTLNWPRQALKEGTLFWAMAATFLGVGMIVNAIVPESQVPNLSNLYYFVGVICAILAAIQTGNIIAFIFDRKFKRTLTTAMVLGTSIIVLILIADCLGTILILLLAPHFFQLSLIPKIFVLSIIPSVLGTSLVVHQVLTWKKGSGLLYWLGMILYATPYIVLVIFGVLIRLGIPT